MNYDFFTPPRIVFGWGRRREIGTLAHSLGRRAFVVCGSRTLESAGALAEIQSAFEEESIESVLVARIAHEPEVTDVDQAVANIRDYGVREGDFVLALGGGSAIDLGKAAGALATNRESSTVRDYLEGVGRGLKIDRPPLPLLAMPTTSGTGSEVTKNAVITSYDPPFKKSLRSEMMVPRLVLLDPELTVSVPPRTTAYTGLDAITQLIESYLSRRAQPIPQALAVQGLELAAGSLATAVGDGTNREAREKMAHAALLSGMALANSGLGIAHGVAAALGACCRVPHGLACAVMLPVAMRVNRQVRPSELARIGGLLTGKSHPSQSTAADAAVAWVEELCRSLDIPSRLSQLGVAAEQIPALVHGSRGNSTNGNPRKLSDRELQVLLEKML